MKRVAVFGMGYVGCVTAACLARDGCQVFGVDIDDEKTSLINRGRSPVAEPGLEDLIAAEVAKGRMKATTDVTEAIDSSEIALIAVGTPSAADGSIDDSAIRRVVASIGNALRAGSDNYVVVLRSTLLPGILEGEITSALTAAIGEPLGNRVHLCNNPEFLRETTAIRDYDRPPFIVIGASSSDAANEVAALYAKSSGEVIVTSTTNAAMIKYACNAYHAVKIDFANEIGTLCKSLGANGQEVMRIVCRDQQLNISSAYLKPGFAFGGSCLPKDVRALVRYAQKQAIQTELLSAVNPSNESHLKRGLHLIHETGLRKVGIVGLSFKSGTDDLRESPLVILAETLLGQGFDLKVFDPHVQVSGLTGANLTYVERHLPHLAGLLVDSCAGLIEHAELIVVGTDVAEGIDFSRFRGQLVDLRRALVTSANDDSM